jgi:hypothetical protein
MCTVERQSVQLHPVHEGHRTRNTKTKIQRYKKIQVHYIGLSSTVSYSTFYIYINNIYIYIYIYIYIEQEMNSYPDEHHFWLKK